MPAKKTNQRNRKPLRGPQLLQRLVNDATPSFSAWHIPEPKLIFAGAALIEDPKTGLHLYGPAALDRSPRESIRVGLIGTGETIQQFRNWVDLARNRIRAGVNSKGKPYDPIMSPDFPGFDQDTPFRCQIDITAVETLTESAISQATSAETYPTRVKEMVGLVTDKLSVLAMKEPAPDVVVCAMPKSVESSCGVEGRAGQRKFKLSPMEKAERRRKNELNKSGQRLLNFDESEITPETVDGKCWDFHNALKARAMKSRLPTQLIWEGTLSGERGTQDPATTAWNFFTALYYKAGNVPWELSFSTSRTCFVGVTFYKESADPDAPTRTCMAQAFSETGEGLVLIGERITWDKSRDKKPHLNEQTAKELLSRVLLMYGQHFNGPPTRVVVHKSSRYWPEEVKGFKAALSEKEIHSFDLLAIERRGIRFLRLGYEPPIRGTVIQLAKRNYLVYTLGYIPYLRVYPGPRVPNPLEVVEHHGDSSPDKVCSEILALTKLNWNSCAFASGEPITIAFSKQVSTIIKELPDGESPLEKYRYYM